MQTTLFDKKPTHCDILRSYLADGEWHNSIELMSRFQRDKYGAYWLGLRSRASQLHKAGELESKMLDGVAWYRLLSQTT